jgi:uncharacterized iron-regulated membrane protein
VTRIDLRHLVLVTHRWLGLATSALLAIAGVTGAFLIWRERPFWEQSELLVLAGRISSPVHERLALGRVGSLVVVSATGLAILMEIGGLILWWRRKTLWVRPGRGWWRACFDLHHLVGALFLPLMLMLAVTGFVMGVLHPSEYPELWRFMARLHRGQYGFPIEVLYVLASVGFLVQGLTGLAVWWGPNATNKVRPQADERARSRT